MSSKKALLVSLVLVGTLGLGGNASYAQRTDDRNIWVLNNTNREISELYVSPHESSSWGPDVLGRTTLPHGIGTVVSFDPRILSSCVMDFKIVYRDRSLQVSDEGRNVCAVLAVQFNVRTSVGLR